MYELFSEHDNSQLYRPVARLFIPKLSGGQLFSMHITVSYSVDVYVTKCTFRVGEPILSTVEMIIYNSDVNDLVYV